MFSYSACFTLVCHGAAIVLASNVFSNSYMIERTCKAAVFSQLRLRGAAGPQPWFRSRKRRIAVSQSKAFGDENLINITKVMFSRQNVRTEGDICDILDINVTFKSIENWEYPDEDSGFEEEVVIERLLNLPNHLKWIGLQEVLRRNLQPCMPNGINLTMLDDDESPHLGAALDNWLETFSELDDAWDGFGTRRPFPDGTPPEVRTP